MNIDELLGRLTRVRRVGRSAWVAICPGHSEKTPSLAIKEVDGRILIHDFGGCEPEAILDALSLTFSDLFSEPLRESRSHRQGFTASEALAALAHEAGLVAIIAADLAARKRIPTPDLERVTVAAGRIAQALDLIYR